MIHDLTRIRNRKTGRFSSYVADAAHWKDDQFTGHLLGVMDPSMAGGIPEYVTANDIRALDLIGNNVVPEPGGIALSGLIAPLMHRPGQRVRRKRA